MVREHLPFGAWLLSWVLIGLAVGHADAVRLLAANMFSMAVPAIGTLGLLPLLAKRAGADPQSWKRSISRAWQIDVLGLLACALLVGAIIILLELRGLHDAAVMLGIIALGLPARHPGQLLVAKLRHVVTWRAGAGGTSLIGAAAVFLLDLGWQGAALVLALRSWGGLLSAILFAPRHVPSDQPAAGPLAFAEAAAQTGAKSRRRLNYRIMAGVLVAMFGPVGGFLARTARGAKLDRRTARLAPQSRAGLMVFTVSAVAASAVFLLISREPATLLLAAVSARLAAPAAAALLWWKYANDEADLDEGLAGRDEDELS